MITGRNAQGKTNLIEAIWLMTGCRSFRGSKDRDCIGFDSSCAEIELSFCSRFRNQKINYRICRSSKEKKIMLNGIPCSGGKKLFEQFCCIAFLPSDISLCEGMPEKRRTFLDMCCSQLRPSLMDYIRKYNLIYAHRSAVLKNSTVSRRELDIWNEQLAAAGAIISHARHSYSCRLDKVCRELYGIAAGNGEELTVSYRSGIYPKDYQYPEKPDSRMISDYRKKLEISENDDIRLGYTQHGIHRDDLNLKINGLPVKLYASQGQKKSSALVMKLAQADILKNETGENPVILLDDVMSELDSSRQQLVSRITGDMQVFATSCGAEMPEFSCRMENGVLECS